MKDGGVGCMAHPHRLHLLKPAISYLERWQAVFCDNRIYTIEDDELAGFTSKAGIWPLFFQYNESW
jgi:hypothetical protein